MFGRNSDNKRQAEGRASRELERHRSVEAEEAGLTELAPVIGRVVTSADVCRTSPSGAAAERNIS